MKAQTAKFWNKARLLTLISPSINRAKGPAFPCDCLHFYSMLTDCSVSSQTAARKPEMFWDRGRRL